MDESAIKRIQETAHIPDIIGQLSDIDTSDSPPIVVLPDNMKVTDLEQYMPTASSYRMRFHTRCINDFTRYAADFDVPGAACFIDADHMSAEVIFDLGTPEEPGHKRNSANIALEKTAALKAILQHTGAELPQKAASDFIEDWADYITVYNQTGDYMNNNAAAHALRNITIEAAREQKSEVGDFNETMSQLERIEAKNSGSIPSQIEFKCTPYQGLKERTFTIRVSILTSGDRPKIMLRIIKWESVKEEMAEELKDILTDAFDGMETVTFVGTAS